MPLLRQGLVDASYAKPRGKRKHLQAFYVDADEMPGAIRPSGTYTVMGEKMLVFLVVRRDGKTMESSGGRRAR
jgi:hypothetical protein